VPPCAPGGEKGGGAGERRPNQKAAWGPPRPVLGLATTNGLLSFRIAQGAAARIGHKEGAQAAHRSKGSLTPIALTEALVV